jgi:hypothetical protein
VEITMRVQFVTRDNGPERLLSEAEVVFGDGPLAGTKLVGFSVWRGQDGEAFVTFPARSFGAGGERRFFDLLRAVDADGETIKRVRTWILEEYRYAVREVA